MHTSDGMRERYVLLSMDDMLDMLVEDGTDLESEEFSPCCEVVRAQFVAGAVLPLLGEGEDV